MSSIRVFVDAHVFDGEYQGTRTYLKEIYLRFLATNPDVTVIFGARDCMNLEAEFGRYSNVKYVQYVSQGSVRRIMVEIPGILKKYSCTHAHFQYVMPLLRNHGCKYIVTIHDILFNQFPAEFSIAYRLKRNFLFRYSARRCDVLLTDSKYSQQAIASQYGIKRENILIAPCGVGDDFFCFSHTKEEAIQLVSRKFGFEKYLLYVSRIEPRKNQTALLNVFVRHRLWERGYRLVFVGKSTLESDFFCRLEKMTEDQRRNVVWLEQVSQYDLKLLYKAAELFVYPSKAEGFGLPPLEAAALGTPVLCSNATAMREFSFFEPYMFDPGSEEEMYAKMELLLKGRPERQINEIRDTIRERYSWDYTSGIVRRLIRGKE